MAKGTFAEPIVGSGSRVVLVVSSGTPAQGGGALVSTPSIVGTEQGHALGKYQEVGLSAHVVNDYSPAVPRGRVMYQYPAANEGAEAGSEGVLVVSSGQPPQRVAGVRLPVVTGKSEAEAVSTLQAAALSPQIVRASSRSVPEGVVIAQVPDEASLMSAFDKPASPWVWVATAAALFVLAAIAFFIFGGGSKVTVPNVVGLDQTQAQTALSEAGLAMGSITTTTTTDAEDGVVVAQTPGTGEETRKGSKVDLVVQAGEALFPVPDVTGMDEAKAAQTLKDAGFEVRVTNAFDDNVDKGLVISQTPTEGQQLAKGTTVGIVVSKGKEATNVTVPDLTGLSQAEAEAALAAAKLTGEFVDSPSETVPEGQVVSQVPRAGEGVAPGTTIGVLISTGASGADNVEVPNTVGKQAGTAKSELQAAGFAVMQIEAVGTGKPTNEVVGQSPGGSTQAPKGSTVILFVSDGS